MKCPYCNNSETRVLDSRDSEEELVTRRRRECEKCSKRFTTYERMDVELKIVKKDGRRENFDRNKLKYGIQQAFHKRNVSSQQIESLIDEIERELLSKQEAEIPSTVIGELVMDKLKARDKVAYIRFASVYREFENVKQFEKEVKKLT